MNQITQEFQKLGITVTVKKRIWMWLKDHPNKSAREIYKALNISEGVTYTSLNDLESRKMVKSSISVYNFGSGRKGVKEYVALGETYELAPVVKSKKAASEVVIYRPEPPKPEPVKRKVTIDDLSIKEAKELYQQLKEIFE